MQDRAFVCERRLKDWSSVHGIFDLTKDPRVRHGAAANQHTVATRFSKLVESACNRCDVTTAGHRHTHSLFNLFDEIPVSKTAIALLLCATVQCDMLDATIFSKPRSLNCIDCVIVEAGADLHG